MSISNSVVEHLPQLLCHVLDQVRSAMKLCRSRLQEDDAPGAIVFGGNNGLMGVDGWVEVRLSYWHHPHDGSQDGNIRTQEPYTFNFAHIGGRDMVGEDLPQRCSDLCSLVHLAPIEADDLCVLGKRGGERRSAVLVPALDDLSIQGADLALLRKEPAWLLEWL